MSENANDSPRISFSNDFSHSDSIPIEQHTKSSTQNSSFDFSVPGGVISGESSWFAEEFFCDGKILPTELKKRPGKNEPGSSKSETTLTRDVKPVLEIEEIGGREDEVKLPLLWNNNSNSSNSKQKQTENKKLPISSSSSSSSNISFQKPPLKKNRGGYSYRGNRGGIRVNSILDVLPSGNLFGLGSINFGGGRKKNKKRIR